MAITDVKDLLAQFDASSLRELSLKQADLELYLSKNDSKVAPPVTTVDVAEPVQVSQVQILPQSPIQEVGAAETPSEVAEGEVVDSPLVGIAYLAPAPDKPAFVSVGDSVKKGQTLLIIEAMKVMNEVPAPRDGVVTEVLVTNGDMVDFGKGLVRLA